MYWAQQNKSMNHKMQSPGLWLKAALNLHLGKTCLKGVPVSLCCRLPIVSLSAFVNFTVCQLPPAPVQFHSALWISQICLQTDPGDQLRWQTLSHTVPVPLQGHHQTEEDRCTLPSGNIKYIYAAAFQLCRRGVFSKNTFSHFTGDMKLESAF